MHVYEYYGQLLKNGGLSLPVEISRELPFDRKLRVMIFIERPDRAWDGLAISRFLDGYNEEDSIYDAI